MRIFTDEHKRRISVAAKRRYEAMSDSERSSCMAIARKSAYTKESIAKANISRSKIYAERGGNNIGRKFSEVAKLKMSASQRRRWDLLSDDEKRSWGTRFGGFKGMSESGRKSISEKLSNRHSAKSACERAEMRKIFLERMSTPEALKRKGEATRRRWASLTKEQRREANAKSIQAANSASKKKTKIERIVEKFLMDFGLCHVYQKAIGPYFADFYIPAMNLVIECDGAYWHSSDKAKAKDAHRDSVMKDMGINVLRLKETAIKKMTKDEFIESIACF